MSHKNHRTSQRNYRNKIGFKEKKHTQKETNKQTKETKPPGFYFIYHCCTLKVHLSNVWKLWPQRVGNLLTYKIKS